MNVVMLDTVDGEGGSGPDDAWMTNRGALGLQDDRSTKRIVHRRTRPLSTISTEPSTLLRKDNGVNPYMPFGGSNSCKSGQRSAGPNIRRENGPGRKSELELVEA